MEYMALLPLLLILASRGTHAQNNDEFRAAFNVYEDSPPTTYVGDVAAASGITRRVNQTIRKLINYYYLEEQPGFEGFFELNNQTGDLRANRVLDRDVICPGQARCELVLKLAARDPAVTYFFRITVTLTIMDKNDQKPGWTQRRLVVHVPENSATNQTFRLSGAEDADSPVFGVKRYVLSSGGAMFGLKTVAGQLVGSAEPFLAIFLVLLKPADREQRDKYRLTLTAFDGGVPANSGSVVVDVIIGDINDHKPVFSSAHYSVLIREDHPVSNAITIVQAEDKDAGANGLVVYSLSEATQRALGNIFQINQTTGVISSKVKLDFEKGSEYTLSITARDSGATALEAEAQVTIKLTDVNNHAPEATVSALTPSGRLELAESTAKNTAVAYISVKDRDSGQGGKFTCALNSPFFEIQRLGQNDFKLMTLVTLDREKRDNYDLAFVCRDHGNPSLNSTRHIVLRVIDENDNTPEFKQQTYSAAIKENNKVGEHIVSVSAQDRDQGNNGRISYRLHRNSGNLFNIEPTTGNITARVSLDYEKLQTLKFLVIAADNGKPTQRSATATVNLVLQDLNDEPPRFNENPYKFTVYENEVAGAEVGRVHAVDKDTAPFNKFTYAFENAFNPLDTFALERSSGIITTRRTLDRETQAAYTVVVVATDTMRPTLSSSATLSISVGDKNDHAPKWQFPARFNNTVHISPDLPKGFLLTKVSASDQDAGMNAKLRFDLLGGHEGFFGLDSQSGVLSVKQPFSDLEDRVFNLLLRVTDGGLEPKHADTMLNIVVNRTLGISAPPQTSLISNQNLAIVISVTMVSAVLVVVLIVAIVMIRRGEEGKRRQKTLNGLLRVENGGAAMVQSDKQLEPDIVPTGHGYQDNQLYSKAPSYPAQQREGAATIPSDIQYQVRQL